MHKRTGDRRLRLCAICVPGTRLGGGETLLGRSQPLLCARPHADLRQGHHGHHVRTAGTLGHTSVPGPIPDRTHSGSRHGRRHDRGVRSDRRVSRGAPPGPFAAWVHPARDGAHPHARAHRRYLHPQQRVRAVPSDGRPVQQDVRPSRSDGLRDQLAGEIARNIAALDRFIGTDGFACCGRVTLADCALVPGLFFIDKVMPAAGVDSPIPASAKVAAYWAAIQKNEHAARVLVELHRGVEERREKIRSGAFDQFRAAQAAAAAAAEHQGASRHGA